MALTILPISGIPMVQPGDDLAALLFTACDRADLRLADSDILVICQKVVSKAEGRLVDLRTVSASPFAEQLAQQTDGKDPRVIELILRETKRIVRMDAGHLIVETGPGWVCANAGVDESNAIREGVVTLLPEDPDRSASELRRALRGHTGVDLAIVITDTFGRPWREGQVEFAIGVAGMEPLLDLRGSRDLNGHELRVTMIGSADQLACAAGLAMEKDQGIAAVLIRGFRYAPPRAATTGEPTGGRALIRRRENDLFR